MAKRPREAEGVATEVGESFWHRGDPVFFSGDNRLALTACKCGAARQPPKARTP